MSVTPIPLTQFRDATLNLYQAPMRAPATRKKMQAALDSLLIVPNLTTTADLTTQAFARWLSAREGNINTTLSLLGTLRAAVNYALEEGWIEKSPSWSRIWPRSAPPAKKRHLEYDQVVKLLGHLKSQASVGWREQRLYALTALIAYTGVRLGEALHSRREDYDLDQRIMWVTPHHRLKTEASAAPVPLATELIPILAAWFPKGAPEKGSKHPHYAFPGVTKIAPWTGGAPGYRALDRLRSEGERAGVPDVTFHGLRSTIGTLIIGRFGGTAEQAKTLLRHTSLFTTEKHYLHRNDLALLHAIAALISFDQTA